jgi:hypothetical protein
MEARQEIIPQLAADPKSHRFQPMDSVVFVVFGLERLIQFKE